MKSIFTFPNNASTSFIDPNYVGDDTEGFQKRIKDLKDGNYLAWPGGRTANESVDDMMAGCSKYNHAIEENSGNNTIYKFWYEPMVECVMRAKNSFTVQSMELVNVSGELRCKVTSTTDISGIPAGTGLFGSDFVTTEMNGFTDVSVKYLQPIDAFNFYLSNDSAGTDFKVTALDDTIYGCQTQPIQPPYNLAKAIRRDFGGVQGCIVKSQQSFPVNHITDTDVIQNLSTFTTANTGTFNAINTPFYQNLMPNTDFTIEVFTDAAKTTRATVQEVTLETMTKTFTSAGDYTLTNLQPTDLINDWGLTQTMQDNLVQVEGDDAGMAYTANGWCRIYATVTNGTFTGKINSSDTIPTGSATYEYEFYWEINRGNGVMGLYDQRGTGSDPQDFRLADAGSGVDVDITVDFIRTGYSTAGIGKYLATDTTDAGATLADVTAGNFEVDVAKILTPGAKTYTYQDSSNVTIPDAIWPSEWWSAGATSTTALGSGELLPTDTAISVDSSGYLTSITFAGGSGTHRGSFDTGESRYFKLIAPADQYVPPTPTPASLEDVFDTEDEWADYGFAGGAKQWPTHVTPMSATITYNSPTIVNNSMSGVKYTRSVGHTKWILAVEYPPMPAEDFQKFHAIAQAAQGQAMPFFFNLRGKNNENILWREFDDESVSTVTARFKQAVSAGDRLALFEGFASNESNAFLQGEVFIDGKNENGRLHTALNTVESNIYGEAKIRTPWPFREAQQIGWEVYKNPAHAVVTLDNDNFEYSVDTAGYYYVSVGFDLDSWK